MREEDRSEKAEGIPLCDWTDEVIDRSGPKGKGTFIYVDISSIDRVSKRIVDPKELPVEKAPSRAKQMLRAGDVLVSMTRPNLNAVALVPPYLDGAIGSTGFHVLRPKHADSGFLFFAVQTREFIQAMSMKVQGALYPAVRPNDISAFCLPPFALARQRRIVSKIEELFSELDAGEESLRRARRQLGVYRQTLLKQVFEGKLTAPWRAQHPDLLESPDQLLARIQAERQQRYQLQLKEWEMAVKEWESVNSNEKRPPKPKKLIPSQENTVVFNTVPPEGWSTLNLSQCVLDLGQGWSPKCENRAAAVGEWAVIKTTAIQFGHFEPSANKVLPKHLPPRRWLRLGDGEILITRAGPRSRCGVVCRVRGNHPRLMLCDKAYRLVLSESATSSEFIERLLCSPAATAAIERLKTGINDSGVNITQSAFLQLALPIPPLPEQEEIVRLLDEQFEVIEQNELEIDAALKRSGALRQSILKKAFSGRLVRQDAADEAAGALLARIREERGAAPGKRKKKRSDGSVRWDGSDGSDEPEQPG